MENIQNVKINVEDYKEYGFGDLYYGLITFIGRYVSENYSPVEIFNDNSSEYSFALFTMKYNLKEILNYLITAEEVYLPKLNRNVKLETLNIQEQEALEDRCKEYLLIKLKEAFQNAEKEKQSKAG